jgi:hypothetical protein
MNRIQVITEGDLDRGLFQAALKENDPSSFEVFPDRDKREKSSRETAIMVTARAAENPKPAKILLALDLDDGNLPGLVHFCERKIKDVIGSIPSAGPRLDILTIGDSKIRVFGVGLPGDPFLTEIGVVSHAADDFILKLMLEPDCYSALKKKEDGCGKKFPDLGKVREKLKRTSDLYASQELFYGKSKQVLQIVKSLTLFGASDATFAESILACAPAPLKNRILAPLREAILF